MALTIGSHMRWKAGERTFTVTSRHGIFAGIVYDDDKSTEQVIVTRLTSEAEVVS